MLQTNILDRQDVMESNVRSYPRNCLCLCSVKAVGLLEGNEYLDFLAGAGTLALGHNHPILMQAIKDVLDSGLPLHTLDLTTPLKDAFSEELLSFFPKDKYILQFPGLLVQMQMKQPSN